MNIIVNKGTPDEWRGTLASLLSQDDGLAQDAAMLTRMLERFEVYHGGGGASPEFTIEREASPARLAESHAELQAALEGMLRHYALSALDCAEWALTGNSQTDAVLRAARRAFDNAKRI